MKKKLVLCVLAVSMLGLGGCTSKAVETKTEAKTQIKTETEAKTETETETEMETIKITTPNAPNSIPLFYMKEKNVMGENISLEIAIHKSGQEAVAKMIKGETDMANFGVQEAANLYNEGVKVRLMDVSTWATFEILTARNDITDWDDLKGKNIWIGDKGGPMDYLTQIVAEAKGVNIETDLEVSRVSTSELAQMVVSDIKDIDTFVLREPFISQVKMKNKDLKTAFDLGEEYQTLFQIKIPQGGTIISEEFLSGREEVVSKFQQEYKKAIEWTKENPKEAGELGAKYMEGPKAEVLESAVKNMDMEFLAIEDSKEILDTYFNKAMEIDETMLEGELPDEKFYEAIYK